MDLVYPQARLGPFIARKKALNTQHQCKKSEIFPDFLKIEQLSTEGASTGHL